MPSSLALQEAGFTLEFHTLRGFAAVMGMGARDDLLGSDGCVVQERLIVPPRLVGEASIMAGGSRGGNPPLLLVGHPDLPPQCAVAVVRPKQGRARVEPQPDAVKVEADGVRLLFSAPLFSPPGRTMQALGAAFQRVSTVLAEGEMGELAVARTWLFMEDILGDYALLNETRERYFRGWPAAARQFFPASTGIQARMFGPQRLSVEFWAFTGDGVTIRPLSSPLQNEPTSYGKLFSRAVQVDFPKATLLLISGTAAIDQRGASLYAADFAGQLNFTLEVIAALLRQAGGDFSAVAQAIVYLKRAADLELCERLLAAAGFPCERTLFQLDIPVCRDELWCEIEVTAVLGWFTAVAPPRRPDAGTHAGAVR